jgi:hypothetical protein
MAYVMAAVTALAVGFLGGLLTFKKAGHWCPTCGDTLRCGAGHDPRRTGGRPR